VRKGEHGTKIVFWKFDKYETETPDGETENKDVPESTLEAMKLLEILCNECAIERQAKPN
jgi:antirestriction protein ArdC